MIVSILCLKAGNSRRYSCLYASPKARRGDRWRKKQLRQTVHQSPLQSAMKQMSNRQAPQVQKDQKQSQ